MMKKWRNGILIAGVACIMGGAVPIASLASSPEFAKSEEEWERLRDNVLEYEEIADLIHEYNVTVQNNQYEYHKFINDYGRTKEDISDAYRDMADELEANMTGEDGMGMVSDFQLELQAKRLREQADDNLEDSKIHYLNYLQTEDSLVLSAQLKFLSYYKNQLELDSAEKQKSILENNYALAQTRYHAGMATEIDVLDAKEAVLNQEKTIAELEQQIETARQNLIVMCGWKGSDQPQIGGIPKTELSVADEIDLEADKQTALENNYVLQINKRKLENAKDPDNQANLQKTIAGNERQIELSVTNAWQNLQTAKQAYRQAVSAKELEEQNRNLAVQKWNAGMITQYDYESAQAVLETKELSVQAAFLDFFEALETYRWNVGGLANAE